MMVATLSKLTDTGAATQYYEASDDYYTEGGKSPSGWYGRGAEALDLKGDVDAEQFVIRRSGFGHCSSRRAELAEAFDESPLPWKVDLVDRASVSEAFGRIIDAGKVALA